MACFPVKPLGAWKTLNNQDIPDLYSLAHVEGWEPNTLHDLGHTSWVGSAVCCKDPAQHLTTARQDLHELDRDRSARVKCYPT